MASGIVWRADEYDICGCSCSQVWKKIILWPAWHVFDVLVLASFILEVTGLTNYDTRIYISLLQLTFPIINPISSEALVHEK